MPQPNIYIGKARPDEDSLLTALIRDSFRDIALRFGLTPINCPKHPSNCRNHWIQKDFARGVTYYILRVNGKPTGCVALEKADVNTSYLERLAVLPEHRRQGFGKLLVHHVLTEAKKIGTKKISIGIIAEQTELKAWYDKMGFKEGETKAFNHLPFLVTFMAYRL